MELTLEQLRQVMPRCPAGRAQVLVPHLNAALSEFEIATPARVAAFLAQVAHESNELTWFEEVWGPTPQQVKYEPPTALATRLGNTEPGDGIRFKGRGPIQLTGRANYRKAGVALGVDLVRDPGRASEPEHGFRVAGWFWAIRGLNVLADEGDFDGITRRINGGLTGKEQRDRYHARALQVLNAEQSKSA